VISWFCQLCLAIKHIHARKILHRDLKSQNIFLTKANQVKIGDFGISKVLENTSDFAWTSLGTPYYLSPEICMGQKYDYKSDTWMLGCILYELCTLRRPFEGDNLNVSLINLIK
jgi:NIMA (never in mitosis gene a)-related kinase